MSVMPRGLLSFFFWGLLGWSLIAQAAASTIAIEDPPVPDAFNPSAYKAAERHDGVRIEALGNGPDRSYIFTPTDESATGLPLVIFLHGWQGTNPKNFGALIDHLVRRGSVVIYPVYQRGANDAPQKITAIAKRSIEQTIEWLGQRHPGRVITDRALYFGFSMGATMAINLAARAPKNGMPSASMLLLSAPGDAHHVHRGPLGRSILVTSLDRLPASVPVVIMSGSEDSTIGVPTAIAYWNQICSQPRPKNLILWPPASHGKQNLRSTHGMPGAPDLRYDIEDIDAPFMPITLAGQAEFSESPSLNILDFHGQWKVVTAALDSLRDRKPPAHWLFSDSKVLRDLGRFEDGKAYPQAYLETACPAKFGR